MILIAYAYPLEVKELKRLVAENGHSGISWFNWRQGKELTVFDGAQLTLIINVGFAGSLCKDLKPGEVVTASSLVCSKYRRYTLTDHAYITKARSFASKNNIRQIVLHTNSEPVVSTRQRGAVIELSGAHAVDMEAADLLQAANKARLPFLSFKIISDSADLNAWDDIKKNGSVLSKKLGETVYEFLGYGSWI